MSFAGKTVMLSMCKKISIYPMIISTRCETWIQRIYRSVHTAKKCRHVNLSFEKWIRLPTFSYIWGLGTSSNQLPHPLTKIWESSLCPCQGNLRIKEIYLLASLAIQVTQTWYNTFTTCILWHVVSGTVQSLLISELNNQTNQDEKLLSFLTGEDNGTDLSLLQSDKHIMSPLVIHESPNLLEAVFWSWQAFLWLWIASMICVQCLLFITSNLTAQLKWCQHM